jgi:hypothetical protein
MPADGTWDPELASKVGAYQSLLGQTPGQTDNPEQYASLVDQLQQRHSAFNTVPDAVPAQDPAYQAFMRQAGAQESEILDEIRYRTEQNSREINRRAAGFAAQKEEVQQNTNTAKTQGAQKIQQDYADRGFGGASSNKEQAVNTLTGNLDIQAQQQIGGVDQTQLEQTAGSRDALAEAARRLNSDANSLYRKRADEELAARNRVAQAALNRSYGSGTAAQTNATYF